MNYKEYLKTSTMAKVTLALLIIDICVAIYISTQVGRYMGSIAAVIGIVITAVIGGLTWLCHYKKPKAALVIEILLTIVLIIGSWQ